MQIPKTINLKINLDGFSDSVTPKWENSKRKPKTKEFATNKIPLWEEKPKIFEKYLSLNMSESIKVNSSNMAYTLLSIDEKILEKIVFIVEIIVEVMLLASKKSPLFY